MVERVTQFKTRKGDVFENEADAELSESFSDLVNFVIAAYGFERAGYFTDIIRTIEDNYDTEMIVSRYVDAVAVVRARNGGKKS